MNAPIRVEALKLSRSPVGVIGTLALLLGTVALLCGITVALTNGQSDLVAKMGPAATRDWAGLLSAAAQITSAGGLLGFGTVLAWMFGREFADRTVSALFALPVGRGRIALAKIAVYLIWVVAVSLLLGLALLVLGGAFGYGRPDAEVWAGLGRQWALGALTGAIAMPVAWVVTLTRSLLAGVGAVIGVVVLTQVAVLAGAGGAMPPAAPALWAMSRGTEVSVGQLAVALVCAAAFVALTWASWARLQLNR
ncbi:ABC transporter permease [Occultella aeris]|uniref:ABC-2 family transporter protein n=1 Tax=Occultella aeris TaxID=2761496 RepID=A0A7M4DPR4_9MICO|nr:ABC transporter permease [Occultella aeris]VZO39458.1 ABC-2 family transporter protein [Occultella aeris]